ncbi:MAG: helix-turn-helix domain-containing protein [Spirochaetales bacterium]|nr:helix-turn-helix domain-containing protein [Spirochaetales bacterium]
MDKNKKPKPFINIGPGYTIKKYIEDRGWSQDDLAQLTEISTKQLSQIINDKVRITINTARLFAKAFGTSPEFWVNLDTNFRLHQDKDEKKESATERKAKIRKYMPVSEISRKGWYVCENSADGYEGLYERVWNKTINDNSPYEEEEKKYCARQKKGNEEFTKLYTITWQQIARKRAEQIKVPEYNKKGLNKIVEDYTRYTTEPDGVVRIIEDLNSVGVKFFVLSHLSKTYLDGACFMDGKNPVIVYTCRYDRVDNFWFTLAHEIAHVLLHLKASSKNYFIDDLKDGDNTATEEKEADEKAEEMLRVNEILNLSQPRTKYFSEAKLKTISEKLKIEESLVLGILQFLRIIDYRSALNKLKKKVKDMFPDDLIIG